MTASTAENSTEVPPVVEAAGATVPHPHSDHAWVWHVTALSIFLGIMLALAVRTTSRIRISTVPGSRLGVSAAFMSRYKDDNRYLQDEVVALRREIDGYMKA